MFDPMSILSVAVKKGDFVIAESNFTVNDIFACLFLLSVATNKNLYPL